MTNFGVVEYNIIKDEIGISSLEYFKLEFGENWIEMFAETMDYGNRFGN